jgi:hypothetical protein
MSAMKTLSIVAALVVGAGSLAVAQTSTTPTTPSPPAGSGSSASPGNGPAGGGAGTVSGKPGAESTNNKGPGKTASVHKPTKHKKKSSAQ